MKQIRGLINMYLRDMQDNNTEEAFDFTPIFDLILLLKESKKSKKPKVPEHLKNAKSYPVCDEQGNWILL